MAHGSAFPVAKLALHNSVPPILMASLRLWLFLVILIPFWKFEVPNKKSTIVSMKSVLASKNYKEAEMELPIALGKNISNETYVVDLSKMPHLLMAGATGQGKSVGLNAVLTSLLYKKHSSEVKFVLVDPKKVALTLFN